MKFLLFKKVQDEDISELTNISIKSFHSDYDYGAPSKFGGPPGYDSDQFHKQMIKKSKAFYKILINDKIIGGFFIFDKGNAHYYLGRIFIDPEHHKNGYGTKSINYLFSTYPNIKKWTLETPPWNSRTKKFYLQLGFNIVKETKEDIFFEKIMD
jgi:RimJ/RimL family protein N-acetyltransferase